MLSVLCVCLSVCMTSTLGLTFLGNDLWPCPGIDFWPPHWHWPSSGTTYDPWPGTTLSANDLWGWPWPGMTWLGNDLPSLGTTLCRINGVMMAWWTVRIWQIFWNGIFTFSASLGCPKEFEVCDGNSKMMDCQMGKIYPIYKLVVKLCCFNIARLSQVQPPGSTLTRKVLTILGTTLPGNELWDRPWPGMTLLSWEQPCPGMTSGVDLDWEQPSFPGKVIPRHAQQLGK